MRLYCASQEVYAGYSIGTWRGALILVWPDGMVGMIADLGNVGLLERLLGRVLVARRACRRPDGIRFTGEQ